jgi:TolB-like protein
MKKIGIAVLWCLTAFGAFAQNITLDEAIQAAASEMGQRLPQGSKVAVLSFTGPSDRLSAYVIDELNNAIVNANEGKITVVDRQQLSLIMEEMRFQTSGLVSDESAQAIGRMLGAQYIVSGSMEPVAGFYRFRARALTVENAAIVYSSSRNVTNDRIVVSLAGGGGGEAAGDFTAAERNRARWLNLFWGAGSFGVQRDIMGGTVTALLDTGGLVCITIGWLRGDLAFLFIGAGAEVAGIVFGFVRPSFARRPGFAAGGFADPANWNIALVSDSRGDPALRLAYTMSF